MAKTRSVATRMDARTVLHLSLAFTGAILAMAPGCVSRSPKATNVEDNAPAPKVPGAPAPSPAPALIQTESPKLTAASALFEKASARQKLGAYADAEQLWKDYIDHYPGFANYDQAQFHLAECLVQLQKTSASLEPLQAVIQTSSDSHLVVEARLLFAESLLQTNRFDEALAISYELMPRRKAERKAGFKRDKDAVGISDAIQPDLVQKIKLYTLRGRILASLKDEKAAQGALYQARKLIENANKTQLSREDRIHLAANWAWRQLEILTLSCPQRNPVPERLSEAEFLAYAEAYYGCVVPAQRLYCQILAAHDAGIQNPALQTYRALALKPLEIREHLPPPARSIKKKEQRGPYESEMKALIEKTVLERSKEYKNLDACGAFDVF